MLLILPLLFSCTRQSARLETGKYFLSPHTLTGTFTDADLEFGVTVCIHPDGSVSVCPTGHGGLSVTFSESGAFTAFGDLSLPLADMTLSRFYPIYRMIIEIREADYEKKPAGRGTYSTSHGTTELVFDKKTLKPISLHSDECTLTLDH